MPSHEDLLYTREVKVFERLYGQADRLLERYGQPDTLLGRADYSLYGDYWGYPQLKLTVGSLKMLEPVIIKGLQDIVRGFPGWEIVVAVAVPGHYEDWPEMGLVIRGSEIVDGLKRQFLPREFQTLAYEGSRIDTAGD